MRKVKNRAGAALLLAMLMIVGLMVYVFRFLDQGQAWASFSANKSAYAGGVLTKGTVTDRNGLLLAEAGSAGNRYAEDAALRLACFHAVGDWAGNVGSGALSAFAAALTGYSSVRGLYTREGKGGTVRLSIDAKLNNAAYNALAGRNGAVLVMDYETGEILCMVSTPAYDPMNVPDLSSSKYEGVYINRALNGLYAPGSVFKLVTLAAAIENIDDLSTRTFSCNGGFTVDGSFVKCSGVHGTQTIEQALGNSCNVAFGQLSLELGGKTLAKYAKALGVTTAGNVSGIVTAAGNFDAAEDDTTDLAWSGIGQSSDLCSPLSILRISAAVARGGSLRNPVLLKGENGGETALLSAETAAKMADMMAYNVSWSYGADKFPGLPLAAKSGTAELGDGSAHAWFTGFLTDSKTPLAFVVIVERGGGGLGVAGAVANTVLQAAVAG